MNLKVWRFSLIMVAFINVLIRLLLIEINACRVGMHSVWSDCVHLLP